MRRNLVTLAVLALLASASSCLFRTPRAAPERAVPQPAEALDPDASSIEVTWIGHATVLIRMDDRWFLTDPVLGDRIATIYPRRVAAGIDPADLPVLDGVLISHAHFDHLDRPSLRRLPSTKVLAIPPGAVQFLPGDLEVGEVAPLARWETWEDAGVTITAVPASHGDGRYLVDRWNKRSHAGFVIEYRGLSVYFAGDTGFIRRYAAELDERFDLDVALIPVGPAGRWKWVERLRRDVHTNPDDAMALFVACGAQWMVPIHFGTFFEDPDVERPLVERAIERAELTDRVRLLGIGETTTFLY